MTLTSEMKGSILDVLTVFIMEIVCQKTTRPQTNVILVNRCVLANSYKFRKKILVIFCYRAPVFLWVCLALYFIFSLMWCPFVNFVSTTHVSFLQHMAIAIYAPRDNDSPKNICSFVCFISVLCFISGLFLCLTFLLYSFFASRFFLCQIFVFFPSKIFPLSTLFV